MERLGVFQLLILAALVPGYVHGEASSACTNITAHSKEYQGCLTPLFLLNSTVNSHDDVCGIFSEVSNCFNLALAKGGDICNVQVVSSVVKTYIDQYLPIDKTLNFGTCNVSAESGSLCSSDRRLSLVARIHCSTMFKSMAEQGQPFACTFAHFLTSCVQDSTQRLGVTCSSDDVTRSLTSGFTTSWVGTNFPSLNLPDCFQTSSIGVDPACTTAVMTRIGDTVDCMGFIGFLSADISTEPMSEVCGLLNEGYTCVQRRLENDAVDCNLQSVKAALSPMYSGYVSKSVIDECAVDPSYTSTSMCSSDSRLVNYIKHSCSYVLGVISFRGPSSTGCQLMINCTDKWLPDMNVNCSNADIYRALQSPEGANGFARKDVSSCYQSHRSKRAAAPYRKNKMDREKRNAVAIQAWLWKEKKIPYVIDKSDFDKSAVLLIIQAISQFNNDVSCIKFVPRANEFDFVRFKSGYGCHSSIGRDGGEQVITIGPDCYYLGVIMHEMVHAVGFFHEQNRWDRDKYVTVHWRNVEPGKEQDFQLQARNILTTLGAPYDYGSIMHYGPYIFTTDPSKPTLSPKYDPHGELGQRDGLSKLDIWKINTLYGCEKGPPPTPTWMTFLSTTQASPTDLTTLTTAPSTTSHVSRATPAPGVPGKPVVMVSVFPNALRINWDEPPSSEPILAYVLTYKLEPDGRPQQIQLSPNKLGYYINTYTSHPGRRYTVTVAAVTAKTRGPDSDPVTARSACSHDIYLESDSYDKIHSPYFKNGYYEQDVICQWKLHAPDKQRVKLIFHSLQIDGNIGCDKDFVRIGDTRLYCNNPPTNGYLLTTGSDVTVTFMSKPGSTNVKPGGFNMSAAADGFSPSNVNIAKLATAFNISWEPPLQTTEQLQNYVIRYKLTSSGIPREVVVPPTSRHFVLSTYPHFGREYEIAVFARFATQSSSPAGPIIERTNCNRNITVSGVQQHLRSPHYPNMYEPGTICEWHVLAVTGRQLVLSLQHSDLGTGDYVDISMPGGNNIRIDRSHPLNQAVVAKSAVVKFVSDDLTEATGFKMNLSLA